MTASGLPRRAATLGAAFDCAGEGIHTGVRSEVRVTPAAAGRGIVFRRAVGSSVAEIPALWTNRRSRPLCTALQAGDGPLVRTVEHLLAALTAMRIDDAVVEIDGEELPIFDGSAAPWCAMIRTAGRVERAAPRRYLRALKPVEHVNGMRRLTIEPADAHFLSVHIELNHFGPLDWSGAVTPESFERELAPSRSFGRVTWTIPAKIRGLWPFGEPLLRGATTKNTAALWRNTAIGGLRMPDEPVRHRALDLVGDLALAGLPLLGRVTAAHPGHEHNHALLAALMSDPTAWDVATLDEDGTPRAAA